MRIAVRFLTFVVWTCLLLPAFAAERSEIPEKYTWNLCDLFATQAAWRSALQGVDRRLPELAAYKGRVGESPESLAGALSTAMDLKKDAVRVFVYAMMKSDEDTRVAGNAALQQEAEQLVTRLRSASSFIDPEILAMDPKTVEAFALKEPRLKEYRAYLDNVLRLRAHTRSPEVEKVIAQSGDLRGAAEGAYGLFTGSDFPYPKITLSTGAQVTLDPSGFARTRGSKVKEDRDKAFRAFFSAHEAFKGTFGSLLYGHVLGHVFEKEARGYGSCVEAALAPNAIPVGVYDQLVRDVNGNLPTLHRYLKLRQRMLGVERLAYEDLYAPMVKSVEMRFTPEQAQEVALQALAPLGPEYVATLKTGFESRWTDWFPSPGKRSGAYSEGGAYGTHPFQLLNFNGSYYDVSTLAHEAGHSMHYYLSNENQPFVTSEHATFVAEVASTLNENLLFRHMIANAKDDDTRLFLLGERLNGFRTTLFRQTLFAEFELRVHQMAQTGEPLTGESLNALYLGLLRRYYGHDAGVCLVDGLYGAEWTYIHHFFSYNFYVYQYATSLTASTCIADQIRAEAAKKPPVTRTRDAYLKMLSSGCSKYPIDLLKDAGADMTSSAPFEAAMDEMNWCMDEAEKILAKKS